MKEQNYPTNQMQTDPHPGFLDHLQGFWVESYALPEETSPFWLESRDTEITPCTFTQMNEDIA